MLPFEIKRWFIIRGASRQGPYSIVDLQNLIAKKQLDASDLAWCQEMAKPLRMQDIDELQHMVAVPGLISRPKSSDSDDKPQPEPQSAPDDESNEKTLVAAPRALKTLAPKPAAPPRPIEDERTQVMSDEERAAISNRQVLGPRASATPTPRPAPLKSEPEVIQSLELDKPSQPTLPAQPSQPSKPAAKLPAAQAPLKSPAPSSVGRAPPPVPTAPAYVPESDPEPAPAPQAAATRPAAPLTAPTPVRAFNSALEPETGSEEAYDLTPENPSKPAASKEEPEEGYESLPDEGGLSEMESLSEASAGEGTASIAYTNPFVKIGTGSYRKKPSTKKIPLTWVVPTVILGAIILAGVFVVKMAKIPGVVSGDVTALTAEPFELELIADDTYPQELSELQYPLITKLEGGIKLAMAKSLDTKTNVKFYFTTNLPPDSKLIIVLDAFRQNSVPLLVKKVKVNASRKFKIDTLIPYKKIIPGEYYLFVVEDEGEPPEFERMLAKMSMAPRRIPALREPKKLVVSRRYTF